MLLEGEALRALVRVHGKINLKWDGIGREHKRGSLLKLQKESKAIMDVVPFLGDESKRLNYYKPYVIEPEHPGILHMKGRCHIMKGLSKPTPTKSEAKNFFSSIFWKIFWVFLYGIQSEDRHRLRERDYWHSRHRLIYVLTR